MNSFFPRQLQQSQIQILAVRITIDLHRLAQFCRGGENPRPIRLQSQPEIVNPPARMTENLHLRVAQGGEVTRRLVFLRPESGMKLTEHKIEPA